MHGEIGLKKDHENKEQWNQQSKSIQTKIKMDTFIRRSLHFLASFPFLFLLIEKWLKFIDNLKTSFSNR